MPAAAVALGSRYPFRLDPALVLLGRGSDFGSGRSVSAAAAFTLSRSATTSSKARRYRAGAVLGRVMFVFMCPV